MLHYAGLPEKFWAEAIFNATYVKIEFLQRRLKIKFHMKHSGTESHQFVISEFLVVMHIFMYQRKIGRSSISEAGKESFLDMIYEAKLIDCGTLTRIVL